MGRETQVDCNCGDGTADHHPLCIYARTPSPNPESIGGLREAAEQARILIGAGKGDHPNEAIRQSNINEAWHILRAALNSTHGIESRD